MYRIIDIVLILGLIFGIAYYIYLKMDHAVILKIKNSIIKNFNIIMTLFRGETKEEIVDKTNDAHKKKSKKGKGSVLLKEIVDKLKSVKTFFSENIYKNKFSIILCICIFMISNLNLQTLFEYGEFGIINNAGMDVQYEMLRSVIIFIFVNIILILQYKKFLKKEQKSK